MNFALHQREGLNGRCPISFPNHELSRQELISDVRPLRSNFKRTTNPLRIIDLRHSRLQLTVPLSGTARYRGYQGQVFANVFQVAELAAKSCHACRPQWSCKPPGHCI